MDKKEEIMDQAYALFLDKGFGEVSVNDIVAKAHATKGGFYYYFKSKNHLIEEVVDRYLTPCFQEPVEKLRACVNTKNCPMGAKGRLEYFFTLEPTSPQGHPIRDFYFLVYEDMKKYHYLEKRRNIFYKERNALVKQIIEEGIGEGSICPHIDPEEWAITINAMKEGIITLKLLDDSIEVCEKCRLLFLNTWEEMKA